jgi:ParB-like chromosome segregation protein Spo0J
MSEQRLSERPSRLVELAIDQLCLDFHRPEHLDKQTVQKYIVMMSLHDQIEPVVVYFDGTKYWLAHGFHRIAAALVLGRETISSIVRQGTLAEMEAECQRNFDAELSELRAGRPH